MAMSITGNPAFEALKVYLIKNHGAKLASGGKEITKKCHICGDSKDPSSRHMYIGIRDGTIVYNCFKCNSSGVVDNQFLKSIDCDDIDLIKLCYENNAYNYRNSVNEQTERFIQFRSFNIIYRDTPGNRKKLASISKRMGFTFTPEDLQRFKIILNLQEFLRDNAVVDFTRSPEIIHELSEFFIGFLSMDNKYINLRRLVPEEKVNPSIRSRYVKYNIFNLDKSDYYTIPTNVFPENLKIRIAEGPFDILGVYLLRESTDNSMYIAIGGKSYLATIKYLISRFGFIQFILHIYADNDIDDYEIQKISQFLKPYGNPIYLHRNTMEGEKDFGVSRNRIIDSAIQLQ